MPNTTEQETLSPVWTQVDTLEGRGITRYSLETKALIDTKDLKGHCSRQLRTGAKSVGERSETLALFTSCGGDREVSP